MPAVVVSVVVSAVLPVVAGVVPVVTPSVVTVVDMAPPLDIPPAAFAVSPILVHMFERHKPPATPHLGTTASPVP
jgi:hypothetical protein